ncbi:MAG TPA: amidohydrolase family protein [Chloroflexota bacterium]|nr:amidohydrolase family protein [Chloroflexota bacterium]
MQLVTARRLLDGSGAPVVVDAALLIDDAGRLVYAGPRAALSALAPGTPRTDLGDRTLLPGIVDAHVHLAFDGGPDPVSAIQATDDDALYAAMAERAAAMLRAGITAARDCGARGWLDVRLRDAIAAGELPGPRLAVAGSPITVADGHCHYLGGCTARGVAAVRGQARRQLDAGADWVKVMVSGGRITAGSDATRPQFDRDEVRAAVDEAHAAGRRLAAHAHATASIGDAVAAGVDSVEHCSWVSPDDDIAYDSTVAAAMAAQGVYACPTLHWRFPMIAARRGPDWQQRRLETIGAMHAAGVPIAFGTDCGIPLVPHDRWAGGLVWLAAALGSPLAAIRAATSGSAACVGLSDVGTLAPGKLADVIAVEGDPSADLGCLQRVVWVMQGGRVVHSPEQANRVG